MKALIALVLLLIPLRASEATRLFEALEPSVVLITSEEGTGSGVVISADGLILTNFHVANTPLAMTVAAIVTENGKRTRKEFPGIRLHRVHVSSDLALLKVEAPNVRFAPARLSKAAADSKAGGVCYALGFPYLPGQNKPVITITQGIINSTRREIAGSSYLQLDAAINPGNSGGALINEDGIVVGIPTLRYEGAERVGLATPILGLRMQDFVPIQQRKGDAAEAARLARVAGTYLLRDGLSFGTDPEAAVIALGLLREALGIDPNNAQWSSQISGLYQRLGLLEPARAYAENAVRIDPSLLGAQLLLGYLHERLKEPEKATKPYLACLALLTADTEKRLKTEVFERLINHFSSRGDAIRTTYLISWSRAALETQPTTAEQLALQRFTQVVPEKLTQALLAKTSGHNLPEMQKLALENPRAIVQPSTVPLAPADVSKVREETVDAAVISSAVTFKDGVTVRLADAPPGVVYHPEKRLLEWTPPPFSKAMEVQVLFLLTNPDGTEEPLVHVIQRK